MDLSSFGFCGIQQTDIGPTSVFARCYAMSGDTAKAKTALLRPLERRRTRYSDPKGSQGGVREATVVGHSWKVRPRRLLFTDAA
jgi:hypothetical protein